MTVNAKRLIERVMRGENPRRILEAGGAWKRDDRSFDEPVMSKVLSGGAQAAEKLVRAFRLHNVNCPKPRMTPYDIENKDYTDSGFEGGDDPAYIGVYYLGDGEWQVSVTIDPGEKQAHKAVMAQIDHRL